jgi:PIN domain nuclease of toxin-antitoxin system
VIVLDTHIWVWWVHGDPRLTAAEQQTLAENESAGLGVSVISCWEVAKLVEYKRLVLPGPTLDWLDQALAYPGVHLLDLSPRIVAESTELPGEFHRDPADQIIVATARVLGCTLMTADEKIREYPHVKLTHPVRAGGGGHPHSRSLPGTTMRALTADDLLGFASTVEGEQLPTIGGRATFALRVLPGGIEITPASSGESRVVTRGKIERVCEEYERLRSTRPDDYKTITFDASYVLALIARYVQVE